MWYLPPAFVRSGLLVTNILVAAALVMWDEKGGLYLVLLTISAGLVRWSWRRLERPLSWSKLIAAGFLLVCTIGLLWPSLVGLIAVCGAVKAEVVSLGIKVVGQDFFIVGLSLSGVLYGIFWYTKSGGDWRFLLVVSVGFLLLKGAYIFLVHMEPVSDFAILWQFAERSVSHGLPSTRGTGLIYLGRTLLYHIPLQYVFGTHPLVYKIANVCVTTACSALIFVWTREYFGSRAARVACVVSLVSVEVWLAAGIPTHDIPGALFTLLALYCFSQAVRQAPTHPYQAALYSLGFGLLVVLVDLQRNTGLILLVACL